MDYAMQSTQDIVPLLRGLKCYADWSQSIDLP